MTVSKKNQIEKVFTLYERKMYHIANAILRDPYAAEDAVIDACIKLMNSGLTIEDPDTDGTKQLIIRITRQAAIDLYRKKQRDGSLVSDEDAMLSLLVDPPEQPEARMEVEAMLNELKPSMRRILVLRFIKDRSVAETARILHISEAAVRKRQQRAIERIRKNLQRKEMSS